MKRRCPSLSCNLRLPNPYLYAAPDLKIDQIIRKGYFYRARDRRRITRYFCKSCGRYFSSSTHSPDYRQKKRDLNPIINKLFCSGVSQNRMAILLQVNPKTVVRKFRLLAARSRSDHKTWLSQFNETKYQEVQFDDLETHEHTKCKPLSVALAVSKKSREILGFQVSRMPANGPLARIARRRYGKRSDQRPEGWNELFRNLQSTVHPQATFESDENPHYPKFVKRYFKNATHLRHPGQRGAVTGQGELKKIRFDPLFSLNHTCAMLRANLNRLFRKTWCTTKTIEGLIDHLSLYVRYHNSVLLPKRASS